MKRRKRTVSNSLCEISRCTLHVPGQVDVNVFALLARRFRGRWTLAKLVRWETRAWNRKDPIPYIERLCSKDRVWELISCGQKSPVSSQVQQWWPEVHAWAFHTLDNYGDAK